MFDGIAPVEMPFDAVAFDLVDARGRTFPLLLQFRPDDESGPGYNAAGVLLSRDSAHTVLAMISCPEPWSAALEMTDESASFFATYAPHGDVETKDIPFSHLSPAQVVKSTIKRSRDGREWFVERMGTIPRSDGTGNWVSLWATVNQPGGACDHASSPDSEVLAMESQISATTRERGHVVLEELRTLCCAAGNLFSLRLKEYSMFSAYHPPAVVRSFTVAALSPVLLSVPSDVLGLIADYARLELPYLPMSLSDEESEASSKAFHHTVDDLEEDTDSEDEDEDEEA